MTGFMFGAFQLVSGLLFVMLSAILIYHRMFSRWLKFGPAFLIMYAVGSYVFFGRVPTLVNEALLWPLCVGLLFIGTPACAAWCVFRQLSLGQIAAAVTCYLAALLALVFFLGFGEKPAVESLLASMPYLLFYIGSPIVVGLCMYRGLAGGAIIGIYVMFCFALLGMMVVTTNYFNRPFGFFYELSPHTKAWIEIGSATTAVLALPWAVGYGLMHGWERREIFGSVMVSLVVVGVVMLMVHLTIGYQLAWVQWAPR